MSYCNTQKKITMMNGTFLKFFHTLCLIGQFANLEEPNELLVFPRGLFVNVFFLL